MSNSKPDILKIAKAKIKSGKIDSIFETQLIAIDKIETLIKVTALNYISNSGASITRQIQMLAMAGLTIKEISEVTNISQKHVKKFIK